MVLRQDQLDPEQIRAVKWEGNPLLLLGGPGSGKTEVLAHRIASLGRSLSEVPSGKVLAFTFSHRALKTLFTKISSYSKESLSCVTLTTFHQFCTALLRQYGSRVGVKADFSIRNQPQEQKQLFAESIFALQQEGAAVDENDIEEFSRVEAVMVRLIPQEEIVSRSHDKEIGKKIALLYGGYLRQLSAKNCLDYPTILVFAHRLLTEHSDILQKTREQYPHICVDEFQDMDFAQYQMLSILFSEKTKSLCICADDDQTLYQWSGANPARLGELRKKLSMKVITLRKSYRCPKSVLQLANQLMLQNPIPQNLPERFALLAAKDFEENSLLYPGEFPDFSDELSWVCEQIQNRPAEQRGQCVVIARSRKLLEEATRVLLRANIDTVLITPKREFESVPFKWLHALLRLANTSETEQLLRVERTFYELEGLQVPTPGEGNLLDNWFEGVLVRKEMEPYTRSFLERAQKLFRKLSQEPQTFLEVVHDAFSWFEEVDRRLSGLPQEEFIDFREERKTWELLEDDIVTRFAETLHLSIFLQELDLAPKVAPIPKDTLPCLTIHTAKGMEFSYVYFIGLADGYLPSFQSIKKDAKVTALEEERRACFVGMTRASQTLSLTHASRYFGWFKRPSRFLQEMNIETIV